MTEDTRRDEGVRELLARLRALDEADADLFRAFLLYAVALTATGRGPMADDRNVYDGVVAVVEMYKALLRTERSPDDEDAIWRAIADLMPDRVFHQALGPRKRRKRRTRRVGRIRMRLNDPHYLEAWLVDRLRRAWCSHHGVRVCDKDGLATIIERGIVAARQIFGITLDADKLATVLRDPKHRRLTKIFYED